ncbi:perlucin-like protein isoform X1 [Mytilus galloprovincialis]|uniref:perlucin-like protein isoform X1 n=1 Tax=Mytilus galloprovincialis TaxID=29158 RepID=UPI003F7B69E9
MNLLYIQLLYFSHAFYAGIYITVANGACPNGWFSHGLSCYFYSKTSVDFADAMVFCKNIDAALVEIESDDENKFIQNSLKNITFKVPPHGYWIGLTDIEIENEWKWIESGNSVSYVNWNPGQPDLRQSENCGILWYSTGFTWHDDFCSDNLAFFICEKEREV